MNVIVLEHTRFPDDIRRTESVLPVRKYRYGTKPDVFSPVPIFPYRVTDSVRLSSYSLIRSLKVRGQLYVTSMGKSGSIFYKRSFQTFLTSLSGFI